jgi:hypothetical protein
MIQEGMSLKAVYYADGNELVAGENGCIRLVIVDVCGQMSRVPWVAAYFDDGKTVLYNLALCEGVELENVEWRCPECGDDADGCYCAEEAETIDGKEGFCNTCHDASGQCGHGIASNGGGS